ncbi:MAG: hypothetical protein Q8R32_01585 [bacterium]|nr:hypothetical protein [bacterium]
MALRVPRAWLVPLLAGVPFVVAVTTLVRSGALKATVPVRVLRAPVAPESTVAITETPFRQTIPMATSLPEAFIEIPLLPPEAPTAVTVRIVQDSTVIGETTETVNAENIVLSVGPFVVHTPGQLAVELTAPSVGDATTGGPRLYWEIDDTAVPDGTLTRGSKAERGNIGITVLRRPRRATVLWERLRAYPTTELPARVRDVALLVLLGLLPTAVWSSPRSTPQQS